MLFVPLLLAAIVLTQLSGRFISSQSEATLEQFRDLHASSINNKLDGFLKTAVSLTTEPTVVSMMELNDQFRLRKLKSPLVDTQFQIGDKTLGPTNLGEQRPLQALIQTISQQNSSILASAVEMRLIDPNGKILGESANLTWKPADNALVFRVLKQKKPTFGDVFTTSDGERHLPLVAPVMSSNGRALGALIVEFSTLSLFDSINHNESQQGIQEAYVVHSGGAATPQLLSKRRSGGQVLTTIESGLNRSDAIIQQMDSAQNSTLQSVSALSLPGWFLITQSNNSEQAALPLSIRNYLLAAVALSALIGVAGWLLVVRPFNKRLLAIVTATKKMLKLDYQVRIGDQIPDCVGTISRHLDQIAGGLNEGVSVRVAVEERLHQLASKDELTGFHNEASLDEELDRLKSEKGHTAAAIIELKLNEYKNIKAAHGNEVAETILMSVAKRLRAALDHQYFVARKNGNEFVIVTEKLDNASNDELVTTINNIFTTSFETSAGELLIACETAASTLASTPQISSAPSSSQEASSSDPVDNDQGLQETTAQQIKLVETAVREQRVKVWYQPVVQLSDGEPPTMVSAEGFVRVFDEAGEVIPPNTFMPHIQESPIGMVLDRSMLIQAIQSLREWISTGQVSDDFCLSINLSRQSVESLEIVKFLKDQLEQQEVPPARLALEITHDAQFINTEAVLKMKELGILVSMDNLGLQNTNIDQLMSIQPAFAKIDHRRLKGENNVERNQEIEERLAAICNIMDMEIIAKSVESADQIAELVSRGIRVCQGFLFDHPRDAESFIDVWGREAGNPSDTEELRKSA